LPSPRSARVPGYLSSLADQAIFFFGQMVDSDALLISYQPPHPSLRRARPFPHDFNENTRLSRCLFERSMKELGFRAIVELPWRHLARSLCARPRRAAGANRSVDRARCRLAPRRGAGDARLV